MKLVVLAAILLLSALPAFAATINVDDTCTLAQAINEANELTTDVGSCEAGDDADSTASPPEDGADTIVISSSVTLSANLPTISTKVTINGHNSDTGVNSTVSGNSQYQIFQITGTGDLTINDLLLAYGTSSQDGGCIVVRGKLTVNRSAIRNCRAGATGRGGGIFAVRAQVTINRSSIYDNRATGNRGGGIYVDMSGSGSLSLAITNSTLTDNHARWGGGIFIKGSNTGASSRLHYVTIYLNQASESSGGGGIRNEARDLQISRSIIWLNTIGSTGTGTPDNCSLSGSPFIQFTQNIIGPSSSAACTAGQTNSDPLISHAQTDQGSIYYIMFTGSPALDAFNPNEQGRANCWNNAVDQIGNSRPVGSGCDYGAVEITGYTKAGTQPGVIAAPTASFTTAVDSGNVLRWNFDASGSGGSITSYAWNFGDGSSGTGQTAAHTYGSSGNYTVTLTVFGPGGSRSATQTISVSTPVVAPTASFSFSAVDNEVSFTSTSTGSNLSFSWDVDGDGNADYTDQNPTHTYAANPATYTVTLTVSNSAGSNSASAAVTVTAPPAVPRSPAARRQSASSGRSSSGGQGGYSHSGERCGMPSRPSNGERDHKYHVMVAQSQQCKLKDERDIDVVASQNPVNAKYMDGNKTTMIDSGSELATVAVLGSVDIFGWISGDHPTVVCFPQRSYIVVFKADAMPRSLHALDVWRVGDRSCASVSYAGTVIAVANSPYSMAWWMEMGGQLIGDPNAPPQELQPTPEPEPAPAPAPAPVCIVEKQAIEARADGSLAHIVQPGDCLWSIAVAYGLTFGELVRLNGIEWNTSIPPIMPGQEIIVGYAASE